DWSGGGTVTAGNDVEGDPAFVDPDNGDYHIGPSSAAIDTGVNAGVTTDIDGEGRPSGAGYDIGADEWVPQ
ncbi:MAG: choice-of-anchor Q domain-containing protein, partial [Anaerolineae bacterium]